VAQRGEKRLNDRDVARAKKTLSDGRGLHLLVREDGKRWVVRVRVDGRRKELGLGGYPVVSLAQARKKADELRRAARIGTPLATAQRTNFQQVWETYWVLRRPTLTHPKSIEQWEQSMADYALPKLGLRPVTDIRSAEILDVLEPIWRATPETARRTLRRMHAVFEYAILKELRERANPCNGVAKQLGRKRAAAKHFAAMPYPAVPAFFQRLCAMRLTPARLCLQWVILTACRANEAYNATCDEVIDGQWIIPAPRTKTRERPHVVPLSNAAMKVLEQARQLRRAVGCKLLFPSALMKGRALSDTAMMKTLRAMAVPATDATVHGFRSSFKDWATECVKVREVVSEAALAHAVKDKTEAAYRRAAYLIERTELMQEWADFLVGR
jgi:integrase